MAVATRRTKTYTPRADLVPPNLNGNGRATAAIAGADGGVARHGRITTQWEYVTPELAEAYRAKNRRNRNFMEGHADRIAADMAAGDWLETHQGIAFDSNDELVDAQHRLDGIIRSGKPQWMLVTRGLDPRCREAIDRGRLRSLANTLQILGYCADLNDNRGVATARSMHAGVDYKRRVRRPTDMAMRRFMEQHREALLFVRTLPGHHYMQAGLSGMLARAYYHAKPEELTRFALAMRDEIPLGEQRPGDRSARALAAAIEKIGHSGGGGRGLIYRKSQNMLRAYLDGEDRNKVHETTENLFPLAGVDTDAAETEAPGEAVATHEGNGQA